MPFHVVKPARIMPSWKLEPWDRSDATFSTIMAYLETQIIKPEPEPPKSPLTNLPLEITFLIFSYLDYPSLAKLRTTSLHMHHATSPQIIAKAKRTYRKALWKEVERPMVDVSYHQMSALARLMAQVLSGIYRGAPDTTAKDIFMCYTCFQWKEPYHFSAKHLKRDRGLGCRGAVKRFCMDCGVRGRWGRGDMFTPSRAWHERHRLFYWNTLQHIVCKGCGEANVVTEGSKSEGLCQGCWVGLESAEQGRGLERYDFSSEEDPWLFIVWPVWKAAGDEESGRKGEESWSLRAREFRAIPILGVS